jgi:hypothetical protein
MAADAAVMIKPDITRLNSADFEAGHLAILEGERGCMLRRFVLPAFPLSNPRTETT